MTFNVRTTGTTPLYDESTGKFCVRLDTWAGATGSEYLSNTVTSVALFDSEDEAIAATDRALDLLEKTGKFPNMTVKF